MSLARRRFRFIKEIAEGGFGKVYLAEQQSVDGFSRIVAVKLLHAKWSSHDEIVMRTRDEARLLGLIRHQHIVKVEDLTSIDGKCALVMEYLEGEDLKNLMSYLRDREEAFPFSVLFEVCVAVASALDAAYNGVPLQGGEPLRVIHRDIKPSNVFLTTSGAVKVLDFGTARANFAEREAKTQALAFGSQGYMAPERMLGEEDTPAADVFSLGVTLYELLTFESFGRIPPRPNKFEAKVQEKLAELPLDGLEPTAQERVRASLRGMLSYEPSERPTAAEIQDEFEVLGQDARDTGLRRFCRTIVSAAKEEEPELETGDPLTGQVLEEDVSSAFGPVEGIPPLNPEEQQFGGGAPAPPPAGTSGPSMAPAPPGTTGPSHAPGQAAAAPAADPPAASGGGSGALKLVLLAGVALMMLVVLAGAGVGAFFFLQAGGETDRAPATVAEAPETTPAPDEGPTGGQVVAQDEREDVPRSPTVVRTQNGEADEIRITSVFGFRAEWDGNGTFELGDLAEGTYRTPVRLAGGDRVRGASFEVEGDKSCAFAFDVAAREWTGECS